MAAPPAAGDDFTVAPFSRQDIVFHATGGTLCALVTLAAAVWMVGAWRAQPPSWPWVLGAVVVGIYVADLVSGLLHWAFDTWFSEDITFIRKMVVMVREHHIYPNRIFQFSFYHDAGTLSWIAMIVTALPISWAVWLAAPGSAAAIAAVLASIVFTVLLVFMLETHKCGHRRQVPAWIRLLQRSGILLSFGHHVRHHSGNHDQNYCIINGWADRTLGRLGLFRGLEWVISRLSGAVPQENDHQWLRRFGRKVVGRGGAAGRSGAAGRASAERTSPTA